MIQEEYVQLEETMNYIQNEVNIFYTCFVFGNIFHYCIQYIHWLSLLQVLDLVLLQGDTQTEGIIMEFSAGVGGQEAMLFCSELLGMYCNYCEKEGWEHELTDHEKSDLEGVRHAALSISHPGLIMKWYTRWAIFTIPYTCLYLQKLTVDCGLKVEFIVCNVFRKLKRVEESIPVQSLLQFFLGLQKSLLQLTQR